MSLELIYLLSAFIIGTIIGSFLNVVILRTHTKRNLGGHSHCMSCGTRLRALDLVPLFSYVLLLGRCRYCGARFSPRYALVELGTGMSFLGVAALGLGIIPTALMFIIAALLVVVFVYDLDHLIIPDEYVVALSAFALVYTVSTVAFGIPLLTTLLAPVLAFGFFGGLWKISNGRWIGLGDAKLSVPLALLVGFDGLVSFVILAFWIGALAAILYMAVQHVVERGQRYLRFLRRPLTMKTEVPFAPFLIVSYVLVHFGQINVFAITEALMGWCTALFL